MRDTPHTSPDHSKFICDHCHRIIAVRAGNMLIVYGLMVEIRQSSNIVCPHCQSASRFYVNRDGAKGRVQTLKKDVDTL